MKTRSIRRPFALACVAVGLLAARSAFAADQLWTPQHVAKLRTVTSAIMSPDGTQIAYTLLVPRDPYGEDFDDGGAWSELHVVAVDGSAPRPYIVGDVNIDSVQWSRDGRALYFLAKRGKDKEKSLYRIPVGGGEAVRVLKHETAIGSYALSPDETRVAFLAEPKTPKEKKDLEEKGFTAEVVEEDLTPTLVWTADLRAGAAKPKALAIDGSASELSWSPVGDRLAVALAPTPLVDDEYMKRRVHVLDASSGDVVMKFDNPGKLGDVRWSPDGRRLAMISAEDVNDPSPGRLLVGDLETGKLKDALPNFEGHVSGIAWQDADTIMYVADVGLDATLGKVKVDGSGQKTIVSPGTAAVLTSITLSKDGQIGAFIGHHASHPGEVFVMKHGDAGPKRLTDSNPWIADMKFAPQEAMTYKARDGLELQGVLVRPLEAAANGKHPLILYVHGGPEAHEANGWMTNYSRPGQVAAARGFAVFYPNYRGSTGRGVVFSKMGQGDEAGREFDDLVDAVKHLVDAGIADEKKVGITGGSYGGYAAAWGATAQSEHFAASVMFVGISNTISKKGTTDIPNEDYLVHTRSHLWEEGKWQFFLERSPIYHVKKARTPILILAGKNDPRVHPSQSMELYRHLKTLNQAPVRLVFYPGEQHGNRKAAARLDYNLRMLQWFEHYLTGPGGAPPDRKLDYELPKKDD